MNQEKSHLAVASRAQDRLLVPEHCDAGKELQFLGLIVTKTTLLTSELIK